MLNERALYYDTDSVIYVSVPGKSDLPTGTMLGELTDELAGFGEGTYISSFISGGPKFYAFEYVKPDGNIGNVCKVKGIRLNFANSQKINYESVRSMIENDEEIVLSSRSIRRTKFHKILMVTESKICKPVYLSLIHI